MAFYLAVFGAADTGLTLSSGSFVEFERLSDGGAPGVAAPNVFVEVGFGVYRFEYSPTEAVVYVLDGGATASPRYQRGVFSPSDAFLDATISSRAAQSTVATQAALDAVNANVAMLDSRAQIAEDDIEILMQYAEGRWRIHTTGPDINKIVFYEPDGVTVLRKFNLFDIAGNPTFNSAYERVPE